LSRPLLATDFEVLSFDSVAVFLAATVSPGRVCLLVDIYLPGISGIDLCKSRPP